MLRLCTAVLAICCVLLVAASAVYAQLQDLKYFGYDPKAAAAAIVRAGNARFTVLTERIIRMEYSGSNNFDDRATLAIVNRNLPVPPFTNSTAGGTLTISTKYITLTYQVGSGAFSANNLQIVSKTGAWSGAYQFGDKDSGNLLGTIRSLDDHCTIPLNCDQNTGMQTNGEDLHCAWGVVSRTGWTTIDDTKNFIMGQQQHSWFANNNAARSSADVDVYFLGHGMDYKGGIAEFTQIGGRVPIPSRPLLGAWFTRWFDYDHSDLQRLLDIFVENGIPLDVLILDMNWHTKNAWTGFSWDKQLFPFPNSTLELIRKRGLMTGANIHDAQGVNPWEDKYAEVARVMGVDPASQTPVLFQPLNRTYTSAVEDILLTYAGFDFFWTDWQQGGNNGGCNGYQLNPTFITDHVRWSDNMRRNWNKRSNNFARFGGLGAHRYPVGFTGDVSFLSWECMSYQPYFSVTASNVAYGYPSHDLVGSATDHELHVRWMQFGAFSGVMRIHDRGMSSGSCWDSGTCGIVDIWQLPFEYFDAIKKAMLARVGLLPYIYRHARKAYDTGLNFVHGLYYEWPTHNSAYGLGPAPGNQAEYMFGDDIVVAVVTAAADSNTNLATVSLWVPPGTWYDNVFGRMLTGPQTVSQQYALADIPMLIRAGAVVPRIPHPHKQGVAKDPFNAVDWYIYPGLKSYSNDAVLYEDDGDSFAYTMGGNSSVAWTAVSYTRPTPTSLHITVGAATPAGQPATITPAQRASRFFLVSMAPVATAKCNGAPVAYDQDGGALTWWYDGFNGQVVLNCGPMPTGSAVTVHVTFITGDENGTPLANAKGYASRAQLAKHILDERQKTPGSHNPQPGWTKQAGSHAAMLIGMAPTASASQFEAATGSAYTQIINNAISELSGNPAPTVPPKPMTSLVQLYDADRKDMCLCATHDCLNANSYYKVMWIEGYQPAGGASGQNAVQLYDYWSWDANDNWADTTTTTPNDYTPATFGDGYVVSQPASGTSPVCLQVWLNGGDHFTLGSQQALDYAKSNGYSQVGGCIGYIFSQNPTTSTGRDIYHDALLALKAERAPGADVLASELLGRVQEMRANGGNAVKHQAVKRARSHGDSLKNIKKQHFQQQKKQKQNELGDSSAQRAIAFLESALP